MNDRQQREIISLLSQPLQWHSRLDSFTSFAIGGPAEAIARVELRSELQPLLNFLAQEGIAWRVIGRGTNLLVRDEGFAGVVILLGQEFGQYREEPLEDRTVVAAGGGCGLARLSLWAAERGLTGLEFGCGIPGTVGGAVIMNAGAWGQDISSIILSVTVVTPEKKERLERSDLEFSYRCWNGYTGYRGMAVVVEVELAMQRGDAAAIKERCKILHERRKATQPHGYANAGSFFKNPPGDSAGRLIESAGLKGMSVGGAMVSERHGNFLVNKGGSTAADVLHLMKIIQDKVEKDCGIRLEPEVHFI